MRKSIAKIVMDFLMEKFQNYIIDKMQKTFKKIDLETTLDIYVHVSEKRKACGKSAGPILISSFDEYLFLFGKLLFILLRKGEIQYTVLEFCLDVFLGDVLTDIEVPLQRR